MQTIYLKNNKNNIIKKTVIIFTTLTVLFIGCSKKEEGNMPSPSKTLEVQKQEYFGEENKLLEEFSEKLSNAKKDVLIKISEIALEKEDGDVNFIVHKHKNKSKIKSYINDLGLSKLNKFGLLNIYVFNPYNETNKDLKPYVYYFPTGIREKDVSVLTGFYNGKEVYIDAKNPPEQIENPIFVIGQNERSYKVEGNSESKNKEDLFYVNGETFSIKPKYSKRVNLMKSNKNSKENNSMESNSMSLTRRVVFSRFTNMRAMHYYESWGKGDAEIRFYAFSSITPTSTSTYFTTPVSASSREISANSAYIDGGYRRLKWWGEVFSTDNWTKTNYFIPANSGHEIKIAVIEEDRLWGGENTAFNKIIRKGTAVFAKEVYDKAGNYLVDGTRWGQFAEQNVNTAINFTNNYIPPVAGFQYQISNDHARGSVKSGIVAAIELIVDFVIGLIGKDDPIGEITISENGTYYVGSGKFRFTIGN